MKETQDLIDIWADNKEIPHAKEIKKALENCRTEILKEEKCTVIKAIFYATKFPIFIKGQLSQAMTNKLETLGWEIETGGRYNEIDTSIKPKESK